MRSILFVLFLTLVQCNIDSNDKVMFRIYERLAFKHCGIDNYTLWLKKQDNFKEFLQIAHFFFADDYIKSEQEKYRLQHQCLRVVERLPIFVGSG